MTRRDDDGIVVGLTWEAVMQRQSGRVSSVSTKAILKDVVRRLDALERRLARGSTMPGAPRVTDWMLRWNILQEDRLRREIAREEALRRERPDEWRRRERERIAGIGPTRL